MADINNNAVWSETDSSNTSLSPFPGFPENQNPSTVNDAARSLMGAVKRWYNHANATATSGGSANAQTLIYTVAPGSLVAGDTFVFVAGASNNASTTLNVNALGAVTIKYNGANLVGGEIVSGQIVKVVYDGTNFQLLSKSGGILNPGFTTGSVVFQSATGLAQDNANFFYSSANHTLGLGTGGANNWRLGILGQSNTTATFSLVVQNSVGTGILYGRDDGVVFLPSYSNGALYMGGGAISSGTLSVANGGTGTTTSTGSGSNVLSASPTFTGTATFAGIVATGIVSSGPSNQLGTPSGNFTTPLTSNTNLLLYNNGATNWAGIGADTGGTMYFVTGTSGTPSTRLTIDPSGTVGASGWNITQAGAGTFNGAMNIGGAYQVGGVTMAQRSGNYFQLLDPSGGDAINVGDLADTTNYYRNTVHNFENRGASVRYAAFTSSGLGIFISPSHNLDMLNDDAFKPNGGSWGNSSDRRIKTNIDYNFDAMAKVRALKPALFDWIHPEAHGGNAASGGFVAQDMLDVFPEFVSTSKAAEEDADLVPDGECLNLSLHNTFFGYLVKAIQELDSEVKELKTKLQQQSE